MRLRVCDGRQRTNQVAVCWSIAGRGRDSAHAWGLVLLAVLVTDIGMSRSCSHSIGRIAGHRCRTCICAHRHRAFQSHFKISLVLASLASQGRTCPSTVFRPMARWRLVSCLFGPRRAYGRVGRGSLANSPAWPVRRGATHCWVTCAPWWESAGGYWTSPESFKRTTLHPARRRCL